MNQLIAVVQDVISDGTHGPYVIATSEYVIGSITFSLKSDVWGENREPEQGNLVVLSDLDKKTSGGRARQPWYYTLATEH